MFDKSPEAVALRKARRAEKRAKQRDANVTRAKLMHVERLKADRLAVVSLSDTARRTPALPRHHVGCSGWYYWHWKGLFYPATLPGSQWFNHYMDNFETVELNAPFYSWPLMTTIKTWQRQAKSRGFIYTVKVCELITHVKRFQGTKTLIKDFGLIADLLGPQMGCFLFQLPPSFHYTPGRLRAITSQLDPMRRNVVEFRHASWWNDTVYKAFRKAGIIFCSCSGPKLPDELIVTADDVYIRFHGKTKWYLHNYDKAELQEWSNRIQSQDVKNVWAYFNNDRDGHAIENARLFAKLLKRNLKRPGIKRP